MKIRFGIITGIFLAIFSLYPQMKLLYVRGSEWQGNYAYNDIDEVAYASYLRALMDGRPRKNDPYTGRDDSPDDPQPESLFSIQFAAPYTLAVPGRLLGITTPWMMTIGGAVAAFLTAVFVFLFLFRLTGSNWYSMAGSLVTLAGGAVFAGEGAMLELFFDGFSYPYFPGFRRYLPALAMPAFFGFVALVWKLLDPAQTRKSAETDTTGGRLISPGMVLTIVLAVIAFAYTLYSYFYIWTMAAAWLVCLAVCWIVARPRGFGRDLKLIGIVGGGCVVMLLPYAYLLSKRSHAIDDVQMLVLTRDPDLFRFPEYIGLIVILIVAAAALTKKIDFRSPVVLFVLSLAVSVFAVFNQQVLTGRSLQPIHYQVFIGNYVAGAALVGAIGLFIRGRTQSEGPSIKAAMALAAAAAVIWGLVECHYTVRVLDNVNLLRDEQMPLARRLTELAKDDPEPNKTIVFHTGIADADDLPTVAPQATLWSRHQHVFAGLTTRENKERYYQYLFYQGVSERQLARSMKDGDFVSIIALFGWGRHTDRLNSDYKPLTYGEIDHEAALYGEYVSGFDPRLSLGTAISYVVVPPDADTDFSTLDRWYDRDEGEKIGEFTLYRVRLRQ